MAISWPGRIALALTILGAASVIWAQEARIVMDSPESSLGTIEARTEISRATFDLGGRVLTFRDPDTRKIEKGSITTALPWPVEHNVPYRITVEKDAQGLVELTNPRLEFLAKWEASKSDLLADQKYHALEQVISKIPSESLTIPSEHRPELEHQLAAAIASTTSNDADEKQELVESFYLQEKSYRGDQQIPFSIFEGARNTCLSACAIRAKGKPNPHGSGVLIGEKLILTCEHVFKQVQGGATKCDALFHFTEQGTGAVFVIARVVYSSPDLDFCVVELGAEIKSPGTPDFQLPACPQLGVQPEMERNDGIYVAGHPEGRPLCVALNSQVVYPFWVSGEDIIQALAELTVLHMFSSAKAYADNAEAHLTVVREFFTASYKRDGVAGLFFRPLGVPTIGADPDTKSGDSGSPVFDIERNSVVGLLRGAMQPTAGGDLEEGANHEFFEFVIPISQIVAELNEKIPTWKTDFAVKFFGDPN